MSRELLLLLLLVTCCSGVWSGARAARGQEAAGQACEGLNSCGKYIKVEVYRGGSQSAPLPPSGDSQLIVKKCDPARKEWSETTVYVTGNAHSIWASSISLVPGKFTLSRAEKSDEGLYKTEKYVNNSCLALINVTVLDHFPDHPVSTTAVPSLDVSSGVTSRATETPEAASSNPVWIIVGISIGIILIAGGVGVQKLIKSKCRPNKDTPEVDPQRLMNESLPHQEQEEDSRV
ncbi:uncharacterized protein LOC143831535 [Paroedura picta]|uniref:uncharacterized protein LOC143831535 n=1 Tax=Paroedura picta TaxID=143630 RepID=UPI004055BCA2